ncbi:procathepsin L-like [Panonychus citri]|uniref:procathepsin L-like n=1 Tax=Panonychus citri TaxID=50023 RepID=UPI002307866D|nr:procathepsin L-like [Panonychus citri]
MLRFAVLATLVALSYGLAVSVNELKQHFEAFKANHSIVYDDKAEEAHRFEVFSKNFAFIKEHNSKAANGEFSFTLGVNKFADLTFDEFSARYLTYKGEAKKPAPLLHNHLAAKDVPTSVDWRDKGAVTGVKDQGSCGSCWAFSACAAIEGANFLKNGKLVSLSEQNLVDCDRSQDEGCNGGLMDNAFDYVISNKGIDTEDSYPYKGKDGSCSFDASKVGATITSYADVASGDEAALASAVAQQPTSVAIDASLFLQLYSGGIFDIGFLCSSDAKSLNHGVTAVGYGTDKKDFWIIKNSWGSGWGEKGFFRMARGKNLCGVATQASYPVV